MPVVSERLRNISEFTACADATLDLIDYLDKLNTGFGRSIVDFQFDRWAEKCKLNRDDISIPKKLVKDAIADYEKKKYDLVKGQLETAQKQIMCEALSKIARIK